MGLGAPAKEKEVSAPGIKGLRSCPALLHQHFPRLRVTWHQMEPLREAIDRAFPTRTISDISKQNARRGNAVGRVTFADGQVAYVKTATDTDRRLTREIAATRYAENHCPVEVPTILAAETKSSPAYCVLTPLPGTPLNEPWTDGEDREPLLREAGRTLAGVHEARFEGPGRIRDGDEHGLELTDETWTETLCGTVEWRAEDWFADRFEEIPQRVVEMLREAAPVLDGVDARLLHGDSSRINVHLDPNGLLDWERALVGDPAFDLVDAYGHLVDQVDVEEAEQPLLTDALHDGYREAAGSLPAGYERRRPIYRVLAFLLVPQTFEAWAPTVDRPDDELAEDVRVEFENRLDAARDSIV
jgi:aminoglycoside phosphotransferase (APT) family kinase protein